MICGGNAAAFTTGRITDAVTGKPIEGATVYAVWYYRPWRLPLPVETQSQSEITCGGVSVARTDANGEYDLGLWMNVEVRLRKAALWVTAPGYYDSHQRNPSRVLIEYRDVLDALSWSAADASPEWSRALTSLAGAPADTKLLAIEANGNPDDCGAVIAPRSDNGYTAAIDATLTDTLCTAGPADTPRTGVFRSMFPRPTHVVPAWGTLVLPLLGEDPSSPVPAAALRNACALLRPDKDPEPTLRIAVEDAESGAPVPRLPVRILWGAGSRKKDGHRSSSEVNARRGFVATTDDAGVIELPVTSDMFDDGPRDPLARETTFHYAAIPLAADRIAFAVQPLQIPIACDADGIIYLSTPADLRGNIITYSERRCAVHNRRKPLPDYLPAVPGGVGQSVLRGAGAIASGTGSSSVSPLLDSRIAPEYRDVPDIIRKENARRSADPVAAANRAIVATYPWQWPPAARLARMYELIEVQPDIETDPGALLAVERDEMRSAFDVLCAEPDDVELYNAFKITRELWWFQAQVDGLDAANNAAQERLATWDDGFRCRYRDGRMVALGHTNPSNPLTVGKVCEVWNVVRPRLDGALVDPPSLDTFGVDYSKRAGACGHLDRSGSSL